VSLSFRRFSRGWEEKKEEEEEEEVTKEEEEEVMVVMAAIVRSTAKGRPMRRMTHRKGTRGEGGEGGGRDSHSCFSTVTGKAASTCVNNGVNGVTFKHVLFPLFPWLPLSAYKHCMK
jgi:hypothetical protein